MLHCQHIAVQIGLFERLLSPSTTTRWCSHTCLQATAGSLCNEHTYLPACPVSLCQVVACTLPDPSVLRCSLVMWKHGKTSLHPSCITLPPCVSGACLFTQLPCLQVTTRLPRLAYSQHAAPCYCYVASRACLFEFLSSPWQCENIWL